MAGRPFSYRDVLPEELEAAWLRSRDPGELDEPELVLSGVGRQAVIVTEARVYRLSAGLLPFGDSGERVAVRSLSDLAEARVREGLFLCRLGLVFTTGEAMQLPVRVADRDKMRLAARMLTTLSLHAQEIAREEAIARQARAQAEAAAGRLERLPTRHTSPRPPAAARSEAATVAPEGVVSGVDAVDLLKGLWHLVEVGALTGAEYQAKKADLLGRL